jgi:mannosylglucosylglycerate synthase
MRCSFVSFRLGTCDGVSVVAEQWARAFVELGFEVQSIAGEGVADTILPWLARDSNEPPDRQALHRCVKDADVVVVENALTIPMNIHASLAVADVLRGRPTIVHHHDPPWQRASHATCTVLPIDDPWWQHVTLTRFTQRQFADRGIRAHTIYNGFDVPDRLADVDERARIRMQLNVEPDEVLLLHPVRAIERKNIPAAIAMAEDIGATYWLTGDAEDGYGPTLDRLLQQCRVRVLRRQLRQSEIRDAYAAADAVLFPSTWEGFGNPPIEASLHARPVVVGRYPASLEQRTFGFDWLEVGDIGRLAEAVESPDHRMLKVNRDLAKRHFSHHVLLDAIRFLLADR